MKPVPEKEGAGKDGVRKISKILEWCEDHVGGHAKTLNPVAI